MKKTDYVIIPVISPHPLKEPFKWQYGQWLNCRDHKNPYPLLTELKNQIALDNKGYLYKSTGKQKNQLSSYYSGCCGSLQVVYLHFPLFPQ